MVVDAAVHVRPAIKQEVTATSTSTDAASDAEIAARIATYEASLHEAHTSAQAAKSARDVLAHRVAALEIELANWNDNYAAMMQKTASQSADLVRLRAEAADHELLKKHVAALPTPEHVQELEARVQGLVERTEHMASEAKQHASFVEDTCTLLAQFTAAGAAVTKDAIVLRSQLPDLARKLTKLDSFIPGISVSVAVHPPDLAPLMWLRDARPAWTAAIQTIADVAHLPSPAALITAISLLSDMIYNQAQALAEKKAQLEAAQAAAAATTLAAVSAAQNGQIEDMQRKLSAVQKQLELELQTRAQIEKHTTTFAADINAQKAQTNALWAETREKAATIQKLDRELNDRKKAYHEEQQTLMAHNTWSEQERAKLHALLDSTQNKLAENQAMLAAAVQDCNTIHEYLAQLVTEQLPEEAALFNAESEKDVPKILASSLNVIAALSRALYCNSLAAVMPPDARAPQDAAATLAELAATRKELADVSAAHTRLRDELAANELARNDARTELEKTRAALERAKRDAAQKHKEALAATADRTRDRAHMDKAVTANKTLMSQVQALTQRAEAAEAAVAMAAKNAIPVQPTDTGKTHSEILHLKDLLASAEDELVRLRSIILSFEQNSHASAEQSKKLSARCDQLRLDGLALETAKKDLERAKDSEIAALDLRLQERTKDYKAAMETIRANACEIEELRKVATHAPSSLVSPDPLIASTHITSSVQQACDGVVAQSSSRVTELEAELAHTREQLGTFRTLYEQLQSRYKDITASAASFQEELARCEAQMKTMHGGFSEQLAIEGPSKDAAEITRLSEQLEERGRLVIWLQERVAHLAEERAAQASADPATAAPPTSRARRGARHADATTKARAEAIQWISTTLGLTPAESEEQIPHVLQCMTALYDEIIRLTTTPAHINLHEVKFKEILFTNTVRIRAWFQNAIYDYFCTQLFHSVEEHALLVKAGFRFSDQLYTVHTSLFMKNLRGWLGVGPEDQGPPPLHVFTTAAAPPAKKTKQAATSSTPSRKAARASSSSCDLLD
jgi:chromosome segregation ATPase